MSSEDAIHTQGGIPWLDTTVITGRHQRPSVFDMHDLADIVGSGEAVGGILTSVVGAGAGGQGVPQLQRIVARCSCEFYFVSFSLDLDPVAKEMAPSIVVSIHDPVVTQSHDQSSEISLTSQHDGFLSAFFVLFNTINIMLVRPL